MATSDPRTTGDLTNCRYCTGLLRVTGGTDPDQATNGFAEAYKCTNCGAKGAYETNDRGGERYYGACKSAGSLHA